MLRKRVSRVLWLALVAAPLAVAASASPAAAITCSTGDTVVVKVVATPQTVPSGSEVTIEFKGFNCTSETQSFTLVTKRFAPDPCGNATSTDPYTFAPHYRIKNTLTFAPRCPGSWRFTLVAFQGTARVSKSWADLTAL